MIVSKLKACCTPTLDWWDTMFCKTSQIKLLRSVKPRTANVSAVFKHLFMDEAMLNYNWVGKFRNKERKSVKNYSIFQDCMLEAWQDHGVNRTNLEESLKRVIQQIYKRERDRFYYRRNRSGL